MEMGRTELQFDIRAMGVGLVEGRFVVFFSLLSFFGGFVFCFLFSGRKKREREREKECLIYLLCVLYMRGLKAC